MGSPAKVPRIKQYLDPNRFEQGEGSQTMTGIFRAKSGKAMAIAAIAALALGACSSSSKGASSTGSGSTSPTTSAGSAVSGTPYKLMWAESTNMSGADKYASVIEKGIDARGGIAGHPLQIVLCVDNNDANTATQCGRQATSDPQMLGLIGNFSTCSSQLLPTLQQAQMASIGDDFFCPEDFKSPVVFPFNAGSFVAAEGSAAGVKYFHDPNVVITTLDEPAGREYPPLVQGVVAPVGGKVVGTVYVPFTTADMAPYAQQLASYKGVQAEGNTAQIGARLGQALDQLGYNEPILYNSVVWYPAAIKAAFGNPTNAYFSQSFNLNSVGWKRFLSDMSTYAPGATYQGLDLVESWLAANVVQEIAKTLPTVSAPAIFNYLSHATALDTFGLTSPLNFTVPFTGFGGLIPRVANPNVALYHYVNGSQVQVTPFENLLGG